MEFMEMHEIPVDKRTIEGKGYLKRFWTNLNENVHNPAPPYALCYTDRSEAL